MNLHVFGRAIRFAMLHSLIFRSTPSCLRAQLRSTSGSGRERPPACTEPGRRDCDSQMVKHTRSPWLCSTLDTKNTSFSGLRSLLKVRLYHLPACYGVDSRGKYSLQAMTGSTCGESGRMRRGPAWACTIDQCPIYEYMMKHNASDWITTAACTLYECHNQRIKY